MGPRLKGDDRQKEIARLLRSNPGKSLVDILAGDWERERWARARKAWQDLWKFGRTDSGLQTRLDGGKARKRRGVDDY